MTKNCHTCPALEYVQGEDHDAAGWTCNKRGGNLPEKQEVALLKKLDSQAYRNRFKPCYVVPAV